MGRAPCCDKQGLKKGPWTPEEDKILVDYIQTNGHGSWRSLPKHAGLLRCGKSCRLRWTNYLRPDIKRGPFTPEEQKSIIQLHGIVGNKWSTIAAQLPGRTDNEIKNYWNTHLKKRLQRMGLDPDTYAPATSATAAAAAANTSAAGGGGTSSSTSTFTAARHMAQWESARLEAEARLSRESLLFSSSSSAVATAATTSTHSATVPGAAEEQLHSPDPEPDFFMRIWNSEVGDSFRKQASCKAPAEGEYESSPETCFTKRSPADADTVKAEDLTSKTGVPVPAEAMDDSSGSNEMAEDASEEESYQLYLNFASDELNLFNAQLGSLSALFSADLHQEASLDTAFK